MTGDPPIVPASKLIALFAYLKEHGVDTERFIDSIESDPSSWRDPATSIQLDLWLALNRRAAATLGDPDFGLNFGLYFWGMPTMLGHLMSACRDIGDSLDQFLRYQRLEHHSWRFESRPVEGSLELVFVPSNRSAEDRLIVDFVFANLVGSNSRMTGVAFKPERVRLHYGEPAFTELHRSVFCCPLAFGSAESSIIVGEEVLRTPIRTASEAVRVQLEEPLERALRAYLVDQRFSTQVLEAIARRRGGKCADLASVARELGLGVRDLQLKLKAEGSTFQELREGFLSRMALDYIGETNLGIKEIAFLLGFSEPSAFHRAFVRWTGKTPGAARAPVRR